MATIKPIDAGTIHRIQSGQVIVDLCSVAKELVENSVDAGASSIEVRFKNQGLDSIEVQDNGSGISPDNYSSLALKHHTSKLSVYDDLSDLQTFGFRGEALSSLSALSELSVITCQAADAPKGTRLTFAPSGALEDTSVVSAKQGTTVVVDNLFHNLPVRRRELERHIKREWSKVISLLNQYACILTGVKFTVSQQPSKGRKIVLFSTKGNPTTRENIINIFGAKTMTAMIPFRLALEMEPTSSSMGSQRRKMASDPYTVTVKGHVSRPAHGEGRQAPDRQMFFVNGRPCGMPQFAKIFNEVYRAFNSSQSPFIFADIQLDTHLYDVNVSPDKRTILLHEQGRMLEGLRESLNALFEAQDYSVPVSQLATQKAPSQGRSSALQATPGLATSSPSPRLATFQARKASEITSRDGEEDDNSEPKPTPASSGPNLGSADSLATGLIRNWIQRKASSKPSEASSPTSSVIEEADDNSSQEAADNLGGFSALAEADRGLPASQSPDPSAQEEDVPLTRVRDLHSGPEKPNQKYPEAGRDSQGEEAPRRPIGPSNPHDEHPDFQSASALLPSRKRTAPDVATVTIGDRTMTSLIGSSAKRRREDSSPTTAHATGSTHRRSNPSVMPSFGGRLSQLFSSNAPPEAASEHQRDDERDSIEDSEMDEDEVADQGFYERDTTGYPDVSADSSSRGPAGTGGVKRATDTAHFRPLDTVVGDTLAGHIPDEVNDDETEDSTTLTKAIDAPLEKRTPIIKLGGRRREPTLQCEQHLRVNVESLDSRIIAWRAAIDSLQSRRDTCSPDESVAEVKDAEEKLTLTISKGDFNAMKIVGQFNLGFILAVRPAGSSNKEGSSRQDELFIIDQHASDEKYNFERLQASTVVQSQRLAHPKTLELTALEEEVVLNNISALETNGFKVTIDVSGDQPVGTRCQLLALPLSKETTFTLADLEELLSLLEESHATSETTAVPRPSKVRKMFAMRACRSSIMVGKALQQKQMERLVRHMGELDKPWNCPHGRPTMRHLCSLKAWDRAGWEGDRGSAVSGLGHSWAEYLAR
ncbi:related to DNA mismatch repair protein PMS1 [Cephalotrichum gorgonifer]|uniref:DNA mismatch repair protein PMS1 n=1 Tax=Cephalotrichum gorgonifer TaxID=2041049 RepID=A0AAE8MXM7_9PEZI|nr:related to DNA mismatch repair protein PMS1 [Cephalotrichum gorgonifer]